MKIFNNDHVACFDVDDTLVIWSPKKSNKKTRRLKVQEPLLNETITIEPNWNIVRLLKEKHARGNTIVVWSQGGPAWAETVVKALNIEQYVDIIIAKPSVIVDDLPATMWMPNPVYISATAKYKKEV
jgi:FMN phosphatase YigB (HAD superfamily)